MIKIIIEEIKKNLIRDSIRLVGLSSSSYEHFIDNQNLLGVNVSSRKEDGKQCFRIAYDVLNILQNSEISNDGYDVIHGEYKSKEGYLRHAFLVDNVGNLLDFAKGTLKKIPIIYENNMEYNPIVSDKEKKNYIFKWKNNYK
jgi:hypothetical protein